MTHPTTPNLSSVVACVLAALSLGGCVTSTTSVASSSPDSSTPAATAVAAAASVPTPSVTSPAAPATSVTAELTPRSFDLTRSDIVAFIDDVSKRHGWPAEEVSALLSQGLHQPRIIAAISRPAETVLKWWEYRERLVTTERIARGVEFWKQHSERLVASAERTGVDPAYIVAIIGIETNFGRNKGSWRVLDALMTLGFDYPPRQTFFRSELEQFLLLVREERLDPLAVRGSYAGAMGAPQFIPSSYRRFAVNGPGDGAADARRDLFDDWDDVIASVANYFTVHGWQRDELVLVEVDAPADTMATLDRRNLNLNTTIGALRTGGISIDASLADTTEALLVPAELADRPNVRLGLRNFHVITRYNRSILYAMAVHDLATAMRAARVDAPVRTDVTTDVTAAP